MSIGATIPVGLAARRQRAKLRPTHQSNPDVLEVPQVGLLKQPSAGEIVSSDAAGCGEPGIG
jgi:hypothetical protein